MEFMERTVFGGGMGERSCPRAGSDDSSRLGQSRDVVVCLGFEPWTGFGSAQTEMRAVDFLCNDCGCAADTGETSQPRRARAAAPLINPA
jgi:hypothetical protein